MYDSARVNRRANLFVAKTRPPSTNAPSRTSAACVASDATRSSRADGEPGIAAALPRKPVECGVENFPVRVTQLNATPPARHAAFKPVRSASFFQHAQVRLSSAALQRPARFRSVAQRFLWCARRAQPGGNSSENKLSTTGVSRRPPSSFPAVDGG